ncbi:mycothiol transferase [Rhodococcus marinonascens]|uniref:mycothiol transferase n=1 Tax=Rhodococcus marinonascens TaxID=38311 RepID=UPI000A05A060|nr:DinB family protein [Rhodococcus marinonascens]
MDHSAVLADAFGRIQEEVHATLSDLPVDALTYRVDEDGNSIAWLVWHLTRVQDDHVAGVAGTEQVWTSAGWEERFGLPFPTSEIGYEQPASDVPLVTSSTDLLLGYYDAVHARTVEYLQTISATDLDAVVDESYDPPVTLGVRLISVVSDDLQHIGQAAYIRGVYERR